MPVSRRQRQPGRQLRKHGRRGLRVRALEHDLDPAGVRRHLLGLSAGAGGVALVGLAVVFGLEARSKWGSVGMHCDANHVCDAEGVSINQDARLFGNAGTIVGGVGLAALITGAVLYVTAPAARPVVEHARVDVYENSRVQISFGGRF